jgi:hypothetical protein
MAIASAIIIAGVLIAASLFVAVGEAVKTTTETTTITTTTTATVATTASNTSSKSPQLATYAVSGTFVSRFCSNISNIATGGGSNEAAGLAFGGGENSLSYSSVLTGIKNTGSSPVSILATCVNAMGWVPTNDTMAGPTATTVGFTVTPSAMLQPGKAANVSVTFTGGSGVYFIPQGGVGITVITSDGSSLKESIDSGQLSTGISPTVLVSIRSVVLSSVNPVLSAVLVFNTTSQISEVDVLINGTYIGSVGVGHSGASPSQYSVSYAIGMKANAPGNISIIPGNRYRVTFMATTNGFYGTRVSSTVVAGCSSSCGVP